MSLVFFNSYSRQKEPFETLQPGVVRMYNCGPTVWGRQHVGNFRAFLFADTLRRWLEVRGFEVRQVMNITDVGHLVADAEEGDDKIQVQALKEGKSPIEIAEAYTQLFLADLKALGCLPAMANPRATAHIDDMLAIIAALEKKGYAYRAGEAGENVYFDVSRFPRYGKLSGNRVEDLVAGARVDVREEKRHPADFALWKSDPKHLMKWPSAYGEHGFPGWHIECSAMARALLGDQLDIHTGGEDNVFPHHECEIAQSEALTDKPFARFWLHTRFLTVDGGKMGKSLGNIYTLDDVRARGFDERTLRYALIRGHYRSPLDFTWKVLEECKSALAGLDEMVSVLEQGGLEAAPDAGVEIVRAAHTAFGDAMDDDLNVPQALGALFALRQDVIQRKIGGAEAVELVRQLLTTAHTALGILPATDSAGDAAIEAKLDARHAAKAARDFATADRIRKELEADGIVLQDVPGGKTLWRRA